MPSDAVRPVLIVEDDPQIRDVLEELLRIEGFASRSATDGAEAIAMVRAGLRPAVILLDGMMPGMSGPQFLEARDLDAGLFGVPVYLVSASGELEDLAGGYRVNGFLRKPFDPDRLFAIVRRHAGKSPA
jgi:CheY-like chemotaxis protein